MAEKAVAKKAPKSLPYDQGKWASAYARNEGEVRHWLIKSELDVFSFADLMAAPAHTTQWDGVRSTGARNFLRDGMKKGDLVFYYHSNADPSAIAGICEVVKEGYPDPTAFDKTNAYYDADSAVDAPMWFAVDVKAVKPLKRQVPLPELKANPALQKMALLRVSRLSIVPVTLQEWNIVIGMSEHSAP
jgi:predicted RNA-binding protein with PUA-like domain